VTPVAAACAILVGIAPPGDGPADGAPVPPQPPSIAGAATHVYKSVGGVDLRLHVFHPPDRPAEKQPAVVFFFGGGWNHGSVEQFVPQSKHLAGRGLSAIVADYRVFGRHRTSPFHAVADAKSAIRWVRAHARELGIDPERIAAGGGSAGGHLALCAALLDGFDEAGEDTRIASTPNALVLFNPVVDTTSAARVSGLGGREREVSPLHHLRAGRPPMLVLHGKNDAAVPYADAVAFCDEAVKRGTTCEIVGYEGADHGFFNHGSRWYDDTVQAMDRFLTGLGYLPRR
jgi:acetyl esterase